MMMHLSKVRGILEHIEVEDMQTGQKYMFPCNKWLSSKHDDKQIVRELICRNDTFWAG